MESPDYRPVLTQIYVNLQNALDTFGASSPQYQTVLEILRDCLRRIDSRKTPLDPDMLGVALEFLELGRANGW
ncbi:hypothetical protein BDV59DRAFT_197065 [Aspergillus ambiguus]|uniref:uncharacterized protein n=1 Tax=Aspergillus ambiguus TaxID=176160 RepID=UPI003CCDABC7